MNHIGKDASDAYEELFDDIKVCPSSGTLVSVATYEDKLKATKSSRCVTVFSCSVSNLFLNSNTYFSLISLLLRLVVAVCVAFFRRLSHIFAVNIR